MPRLAALLTLALVAALVLGLVSLRPFDGLTRGLPPLETLAFERVAFDAGGLRALVRAGGSEPVTIAQVQIDGAFRTFTQDPPGPIPRLGTATLDIRYPWTEGEPLTVSLVTSTGLTFAHVAEVAFDSAGTGSAGILQLIGIGLFVGFVPILAGYGFLPALRAWGARGRDFALGLTFGLLAFLLIDTTGEGLGFAAAASAGLNATMAYWSVMLLVAATLLAAARRGGGAPGAARLAFFIAFGIGLHNLGEGIAIGAAVSVGEVALASFLAIGFFLHNLSEAIAIAAPYRGAKAGLATLVGLAALAGLPAAAGTVAGAFAFTPLAATIAFAIGAGAILQVLIEIGALMLRLAGEAGGRVGAPAALGFGGGLAVLYATTLLIPA